MNLNEISILLADDDMDDCLFFKRALEEFPTSPKLTTVNDGDQLMKYLHENINHLPDVLFLDINMPRKNGTECLLEIRENDKLKRLPVVMFSTSNSWETINLLFKSGAHVYIRKPSDFAQLKEVIHNAIPIATEKTFPDKSINYILNPPIPDRY